MSLDLGWNNRRVRRVVQNKEKLKQTRVEGHDHFRITSVQQRSHGLFVLKIHSSVIAQHYSLPDKVSLLYHAIAILWGSAMRESMMIVSENTQLLTMFCMMCERRERASVL